MFNRYSGRLAVVLAAALLGMAAHATQPGNNGGGNGGCGNGQQTNGCGGQGGAGGSGLGVGVGVGVGIASAGAQAAATGGSAAVVGSGNSSSSSGAAVVGSGNSSVRNSSRNTNTATTGASNSGGNTLTGGATSVTVEGDKAQERAPVATAYAAPLTSSNGTCMGSSSGGVQGAAVGLTIGTTWTDNNCDIRYDAIALREAGMPAAALARLCQKKELAEAMAAAGQECPNAKKTAAVSAPVVARSGDAIDALDLQGQRYADPITRKRLGLPPL